MGAGASVSGPAVEKESAQAQCKEAGVSWDEERWNGAKEEDGTVPGSVWNAWIAAHMDVGATAAVAVAIEATICLPSTTFVNLELDDTPSLAGVQVEGEGRNVAVSTGKTSKEYCYYTSIKTRVPLPQASVCAWRAEVSFAEARVG